MKNYFIFALVLAIFGLTGVNAQESETNDNADFSRWQARLRVISIIPSEGDDIDGADVEISTAFVPELDFTYFFDENWAAELILGTAKHNVDVEDTDLGHVWLLPPTLNLQYHFDAGGVSPYLGAGVNYTIFYGVDAGDVVDLDYENSFGFSFQAGVDIDLDEKWFINIDAKKILLKTDVDVDTGEGVLPVEVEINPFVVGAGVGLRF